MFVMMRHGERGDQALPPELSNIEFDPPLSNKGKQEINNMAHNLASLIQSQGIKKIEIHTSPFLRCLMTAEKLKKCLKIELPQIDISDKIIVNNMFGQFLRTDWFQSMPFDKLVLTSTAAEQYVDKSKFVVDSSVEGISFPQNYTKFCYRANVAKQKFIKDQPADLCKIIVTHGFIVKELCVNSFLYLRFGQQIPYCQYEAVMNDKVLKYLNKPLEMSRL